MSAPAAAWRASFIGRSRKGRCRAGNAGLDAASGELIGFLDDDLLYADHVETLVAELAAHTQCAAVYGLAFEIPTQVVSRDPFRYRECSPVLMHDQPFSRPALGRRNYLPIQSVLFRREIYERHGGFDPELENYEDWNLWVRYSLERDFGRVAKATSLYRVPADPREMLRRNGIRDQYYGKALVRQAQLLAAAGQPPAPMHRSARPSTQVVSRLLVWLPPARWLYAPARRLAALWRHRSAAQVVAR
ncbi:MAG: glycosyltransferase [Pseudomonadota bacterium]